MACRLTIDLSPPFLQLCCLPRCMRSCTDLMFRHTDRLVLRFWVKTRPKPALPRHKPPPRPRPGPPGTPSLPRCLVRITLLAGHLGFRGKPIGTSPQHPSQLPMLLLLPPPLLPPSLTPPLGALSK